MVLLACIWRPGTANAVIHPASVLAGPAQGILGVDGVALAGDGSGGVLYGEEVEGVAHLFVAPLSDGAWGAPVEVDREDAYGASQATIAAGDGGRLLVAWVQPRNIDSRDVAEYELMSASLQPGSGSFGQAIAIDTSVGEPDTGDVSGVDPTIAMAPDGLAYVVYRQIADDCRLGDEDNPEEAKCRPGSTYEVVHVRVARFNYLTWSSLGTINRAPQLAMTKPTPENAPSIGIALNGNGVVTWQEPDASGVPRIWVRRLFGTVLGNALQASPETIGGRPVTSEADAPAVTVGPYGEAEIAYRIHGAPGSAVATTQLFLNSLADEFGLHGSELRGAAALAGTEQAGLGVPSGSIAQPDEEEFRLAWTQSGAVREVTGSAKGTGMPVTIGASAAQAYTTINPAGGGTTVWTAPSGAPPAVEVREAFPQGAYQAAQLTGNVTGPVTDLSLGGDGQGDALAGWLQGPLGDSEVIGDFTQAPPGQFLVFTPLGWITPHEDSISWEAPFDAVSGVTYSIYIDGKLRVAGLTSPSVRLPLAGLGNGIHDLQVLATDTSGQQTMSGERQLKLDVQPPTVRARLIDRGHGVRVSVTDNASGVDAKATRISFGDGAHAEGSASASHAYARPGRYTLTASVRDKAGIHATVHLRVKVE
jgi:PKD domain